MTPPSSSTEKAFRPPAGVMVIGIDNGETPVVLIHGAMATGVSEWWWTAQRLGQHRPTILVDCPGHGDAAHVEGASDLEASAQYIASLIQRSPWGRVHVIGHSNGGSIALLLALRYPELVASAVIQGGNSSVSPGLVAALEAARGLGGRRPDLAERWSRLHSGGGHHWWSRLHDQTLEAAMTGPRLTRDELSGCQVATFVIEGTGDELNVSEGHAARLAEGLPNCVFWAPDAGHEVHVELPGEWTDRVLQFMTDAEGRSPWVASRSGPESWTVTAAVTDLRHSPDSHAERVSQLLFGDRFEVVGGERGWVLGRRPADGENGWVKGDHLLRSSDDSGDELRVVAPLVPYRRFDGRDGAGMLPLGAAVRGIGTGTDGTTVVSHPGGPQIVLKSGGVRPMNRTLEVEESLELGARLVGTPYLWGGCSPFGYDCSGLVQSLFGLCGITLPRDSYQQYAATTPTDRPRPGDLVFFAPPGERIDHVGLMVTDQNFIHAWGRTGMVTITAIGDDEAADLMASWVGYRRVPSQHDD